MSTFTRIHKKAFDRWIQSITFNPYNYISEREALKKFNNVRNSLQLFTAINTPNMQKTQPEFLWGLQNREIDFSWAIRYAYLLHNPEKLFDIYVKHKEDQLNGNF